MRSFIRGRLPVAGKLLRLVRTVPLRVASRQRVFTRIYERNEWEGAESLSGPGSDPAQTAALRRELPALLAELGCRSLLDAPCGDFRWMGETALSLDRYVGVDIVAAVVESNRGLYGAPGRTFLRLDILTDPLPGADLVLCRDCLVHLSCRDARQALRTLHASGSTWLLTTTFPHHGGNQDIVTGEWRPLNLERPPFGLPPPLRRIDEGCSLEGGRYADKSLGLWRLADLGSLLG
ncbi:MAG: class I SAM-dependent methyltransferase [Acidobacteriota bacterium]|nr:class I SAM-dependent methyltransferase [Acidobacteriota bacterium]